jgi:uncharacterized membrane protein (UPF0136 family)
MFRHLAGVAALLYGLASIVGGTLGYVGEKKSIASLAAGGSCGLILLLCGVGIFKGPKTSFLSLLGAALVSFALVGFFVYDTIKHADNLGAFFQETLGQTALVMLGGGAIVLILTLTALYRRAK